MTIPTATTSRTARASPAFAGDVGRRDLDHLRHDEPLHRHPRVGEHLLRAARARDRRLRAVPARQGDGRRARPTRRRRQAHGAERVPSFTLGVADASPLEMAEAYATFAARGLHCDSRPVTAIEDATGNVLKELPRRRASRCCREATADAVNDILRGVQEPGGFGYDIGGTGLTVAVRPARPAPPRTASRSGSSATPPSSPTAAMIAGANKVGGTADRARRPDASAATTSTRSPAPASPARCGATRCRRSRAAPGRGLRRAVRPSSVDGDPTTGAAASPA